MVKRLDTVDWSMFLARPRLPSPSPQALDRLHGIPMLITGAGGSIGSALAQSVSRLDPSALVLLDFSESRLYQLQQDWIINSVPGNMIPFLGSVSDAALLDEVFSGHAPQLVFHAAAFKHVPLLEEQPLAAILNNIFGTLALCRAATAHSAQVVLLSTDKAVAPSSMMGATKRVSEQIVLAAGGTVLRLGNVLATRDSVTETFARQIESRQPLTVTDPAARRYFLTIEEAVNMLLIAASDPQPARLLAPQLSEPHYVADLAHFMAGSLAAGQEVHVDFTTLRPGDKEVERLWSTTELPRAASHAGLLQLQLPAARAGEFESELAALRIATDARDRSAALAHLRVLVPDYTPSSVVLALCDHRGSS